jgi:putative methyltransferase (TIGR04325 family)
MKQFLKGLVHLFPATSNAWWYWGVFPRGTAAVRGIYPTWKAAQVAAVTKHRLPSKTSILTYRAPEGVQIHSLAERDYPIVLHMQSLLSPDTRVLNIGGSLAKEYASYRSLIPFPEGLRWHISEVPEVAAAGQQMVETGDYPGLSFGTEISGGADILLVCGALQYLTATLPEVLSEFDTLPGCVSRVVENLRRRPPSGLICA